MTKFIALAFAAVLVGIDQVIKLRVLDNLVEVGQIEVIPGLFYLTYVENRGAAFGILQGKTALLTVITSFVLIAIVYLMVTGRVKGRLLMGTLSLIVAGGAGNLIDRIWRGYVVDYLDFSALFGFPVFNFADCCVVVGTILLLCTILWTDHRSTQVLSPRPDQHDEPDDSDDGSASEPEA